MTNKRGRPSKFDAVMCVQVEKLCKLGAKDEEIADFFGVSEQTLNTWKKAHPEFLESIKRGKVIADAEVASKLFHRATGYEHEAVKIFNDQGTPLVVPYTEHYPPDTTAAIFWLKNRRKNWGDKTQHELTGKDGGPIEGKETVSMDEKTIAAIVAQLKDDY